MNLSAKTTCSFSISYLFLINDRHLIDDRTPTTTKPRPFCRQVELTMLVSFQQGGGRLDTCPPCQHAIVYLNCGNSILKLNIIKLSYLKLLASQTAVISLEAGAAMAFWISIPAHNHSIILTRSRLWCRLCCRHSNQP